MSNERADLLARLDALNKGEEAMARIYARYPVEALRQAVVETEQVEAEIARRGSRLAAVWDSSEMELTPASEVEIEDEGKAA
ncbi:hypothetical protein V5F77_27785 [Xanthobacter sp. DSM 24535]|uniref:hypothetical protein n=1 Tax=Roseixanthobacter psychrophilus TaxID=3119917 RepID=UPI00372A3D18